jgi:hypothetical protein
MARTTTKNFKNLSDSEQVEVREAHLKYQGELIAKKGAEAINDARFQSIEVFAEDFLKPEPVNLTPEKMLVLSAKGWGTEKYQPKNGEEGTYLTSKKCVMKSGGFLNLSSKERLVTTRERLVANIEAIDILLG